MNEPDSNSSLPAGTATGYSVIGRRLLTVTANSATSHDSLIDTLLRTTFPKLSPLPGETVEGFAVRVAEAAGLTVANWECSGE